MQGRQVGLAQALPLELNTRLVDSISFASVAGEVRFLAAPARKSQLFSAIAVQRVHFGGPKSQLFSTSAAPEVYNEAHGREHHLFNNSLRAKLARHDTALVRHGH